MIRKEILSEIKRHKDEVTTVRHWNKYAELHELPKSVTIVHYFGSWNDFKKALGIKGIKNVRYNKETLLEIAQAHSDKFTSKREWDEYARHKGLPTSPTYISFFKKWNDIKEYLHIEKTTTTKKGYSKDDIVTILKQHGKNLINRQQWDQYAKEKNLPTYKTLRKHLSWNEILSYSGIKKKYKYDKKSLLDDATSHYQKFISSTMKEWDEYAKSNFLPSSGAYYRTFGTWKKAKVECIKQKSETP